MAVSLQVLYPVGEGTTFDYDYYLGQHMAIVGDVMGEHIESTLVTKGLAGGPGVAAGSLCIFLGSDHFRFFSAWALLSN